MRNKKMMDNVAYRKPTNQEIRQVSGWVNAYYESRIKKTKTASSVLTVVGLLLMGSISGGIGIESILGCVLGLLCFFGVYSAIRAKNNMRGIISSCEEGDFRVCDGHLTKVLSGQDMPGYQYGWFVADHGGYEGRCLVRVEDGIVGSSAIRITVQDRYFTFTPFMLTDEGIRLHW